MTKTIRESVLKELKGEWNVQDEDVKKDLIKVIDLAAHMTAEEIFKEVDVRGDCISFDNIDWWHKFKKKWGVKP